MKAIIIEVERSAYGPQDVERPITVGKLREILEEYDEDTPIYLSHDCGYTYGTIEARNIEEKEIED